MGVINANNPSGKTTCLDVLAQRKNIGVISGSMLVDGRPIGADFARGTAYGGFPEQCLANTVDALLL